jgi:DNA-binding beta-propeller fold protein YncE
MRELVLPIVGALVLVGVGAGYIRAVARGDVRPNRVTWGIWSLSGWVAVVAQVSEGVGMPVLLAFLVALVPSGVAIATFLAPPGVPDPELTWQPVVNRVCAAGSAVALAARFATSGSTALLLAVVVDAVAGLPTITQDWRRPHEDSLLPWLGGLFSALCTLAALPAFTWIDAGWALYFGTLCLLVSAVLLVRRRIVAPSAPAGDAPTGPLRIVAPDDVAPAIVPPRRRVGPLLAAASVASLLAGLVAGGAAGAATGGTLQLRLSGRAAAIPAAEAPGGDSRGAAAPVASRPGPAGVPAVTTSLRVDGAPSFVAATPDGGALWVADPQTRRIVVIDSRTARIRATFGVRAGPPRSVTFCPDGRAYLSVYTEGDPAQPDLVVVLDTATQAEVAAIPIAPPMAGPPPILARAFVAACGPDGRLVVPSRGTGRIEVVDTATERVVPAAGRAMPADPHWVAASHDGRTVAVTGHGADVVTLADAATLTGTARIPVGHGAHAVAISPDDATIAVTCYDDAALWLIDRAGGRVTARVPVGRGPQGLAWTPDGRVLTADTESDRVSVVDVATGAVVAVPARDPVAVTVLPDGSAAWVAGGDGTVSELRL